MALLLLAKRSGSLRGLLLRQFLLLFFYHLSSTLLERPVPGELLPVTVDERFTLVGRCRCLRRGRCPLGLCHSQNRKPTLGPEPRPGLCVDRLRALRLRRPCI